MNIKFYPQGISVRLGNISTFYIIFSGKWKNVQVSVKTSDMDNAGTQAEVYITAYGTKGQSDKLSLSSANNTQVFDKGAESEVNVSIICSTH